MPSALPVVIPVDEPDPARYAAAAQLLERAAQTGGQDPQVLYMLAMAHKRQGKINDARNALRKIQRPDANVVLQMGLLSLQENQLAQAEDELARAWQMDPRSYEICYNLLLTRLTMGKVEDCLALIPTALELVLASGVASAPREAVPRGADATPLAKTQEDERRFLLVLQALLQACRKSEGGVSPSVPLLNELTTADEQRLLKVLRSLGQLDTVHTLLKALTEARPRSAAVREAYLEAVLVKAKELIDRCAWTEAELLLRPLARERSGSRATQVALLTLFGCCACMTQDFDSAIKHYSAAIKLAPNDARLHQNLALTYELKGELPQSDPYWNRFFDLLDDRVPAPEYIPHYLDHLSYESLGRLAARYTEKEKWTSALNYVQRAAHLRPNDPDTLERLFHLYNQAKRPQDARRTLDNLRRLRPGEPQYELYELDLVEVKGLNDIEKLLTEIDRILKRYPNDARVEERAVTMVGNVIPLMGNLCDQLTDQMSKVIDQVRNLPNYQINWSAVREVMRDLLREFQKLRRITGKCLPLVSSDEHRRIVRDLADHIDKKMEACRSMGA
ncbi:MAG TPA: tetratricopeptide repeat protein [Gemmataceae bacterium]|nr:tetratricopeptide repeat protein [Gemmataceae bacterium]